MSLLEKDKRKFSVIIGSKKCGACSGASPSGAARKVKEKSGAFYLKETTKGSKKKLYGPYSSKKRVVQRGGLRAGLCKNLLHMFDICPSFERKKIDDDCYESIKNAFRLLGIRSMDENRYTKLKYLILLRTQHTGNGIPTLCQLLCSEELPELELYIDPEIDFIIDFKKNFPKGTDLYIEGFSTWNWINFIQYFNHQLKNMEIRNKTCLDVLRVLNNCDSISHPAHFKDLLLNVYINLGISVQENNCNILKGILKLREIQTPSLLDVLFNINENLEIETLFIYNNFSEITKLKQYSSVQKLTQMWHTVIKYIRTFIDSRIRETIEGIEAKRAISEKNFQNMLGRLEEEKEKVKKNKEILNKMMMEYEKAKASSSGNNLQQLSNKSFLLSSQRNGNKSSIPSYLLMSTINNRSRVARDGPAEESLNNRRNFAKAGPAEENLNNRRNSTEVDPAEENLNNRRNSTEVDPEQILPFISPLMRVQYTGKREPPQINKSNTNSKTSMLNNQIAVPANVNNTPQSRKILLEQLAALLND